MNPNLTIETLKKSAKEFCDIESSHLNTDLYGVTDGKAVGTYIEHKFKKYLLDNYTYENGSSAKGVDLPGPTIRTDIKVTSIRQPQSSSPFKDAKQKMSGGEHAWDLITESDQAIASGLYLFTVKNSNNGNIKRGKFLVIK